MGRAWRLAPSLETLEKEVKERQYKGVYIHIYCYDIGLDHRKMNRLYQGVRQAGSPTGAGGGRIVGERNASPFRVDLH